MVTSTMKKIITIKQSKGKRVLRWGRIDILQRVVREGLPKEVGVKQKSDGEKSEGRVLKPRATANTEALRQESLGALEQCFPNVSVRSGRAC